MIAPGQHLSVASRRATRAIVAALALIAAVGCDKVPLTAPTGSTLALFASSTVIPANGVSEITATVTESAGTPVQNGTVVTFTSTLGSVDPADARTNNGKVTVRFISNGQSGVAVVRAFSGGANTSTTTSNGSTSTTSTSAEVQIRVGAAAAGAISVSASPANLPSSGGTSTITAHVLDSNGNALGGVPVTFSATAGNLAQSTVSTDGNGDARTQLTTNLQSEVTATAGISTTSGTTTTTAPTAKVTVTVNTGLSITITSSSSGGTTPTVDQPVLFTLTVQSVSFTNPAVTREVVVDFGDGTTQTLGALTGTTSLAHVYSSPGSYTVTATATATTGEVTRASTVVVVRALDPFTVSLSGTLTAPTQTPLQFTASVSSSSGTTPAISRYEWNFGDDSGTIILNSPTTSHVYGKPGTYTVSVRAVAADGRSAVGQLQISITP